MILLIIIGFIRLKCEINYLRENIMIIRKRVNEILNESN